MGCLNTFILHYLTLHLLQTLATSIPDRNGMDLPCPGKDSCVSSDILDRNCECDDVCLNYGDCCLDAEVADISRNAANNQMICTSYGDADYEAGAYMISTCLDAYAGPKEVQLGCLNQNDTSDPLMQAPVTDPVSGITYRNRYCADCNNAFVPDLLSWLIALKCEFPMPAEGMSNSMWGKIRYMERKKKWGVMIGNQFHRCHLDYEIPSSLESNVRSCNPSVVSRCPDTWKDVSVSTACESYSATVYAGDDVAFKNPHCAICNGVGLKHFGCEADVTERKKKPFSFALLLDVNMSDGDVVGVSRPDGTICGIDQKYDPFFKKCRNLVCVLPNYRRRNGKCTKVE